MAMPSLGAPSPRTRSTRMLRAGAAMSAALLLFAAGCAHVRAQEAPGVQASGEQKTVVLLVNFADRATQPLTPAAAHALVFGTVSDLYWEMSYGRTFFGGDTFGWFTLPVSSSGCDVHLVAREADRAAIAAGVDLAAYDRIVYMAPQNACTATGYNSGIDLPSRVWLFTDSFNARVVGHELGHNFGLSHSQALDCGTDVLGEGCKRHSYGDAADTMGSGATPHFNAFQKELVGWLGAAGQPGLTTVTASGRHRIEPMAAPGTGPKALKIARGRDALTGEMNYYYVEYRQPVGFDAVLGNAGNLAEGVLLHTGGPNQYSLLLDMTPDSDPASSFHDIRDSALVAGRTYADAAAGIRITLVAADASGATVDVVLGGTAPAPACTRATPALSLAGPTAPLAAGSTATYTLTLANRDSEACAATTFGLARSVPADWSGALAATALSLSPGASGSTTLQVTSAAGAGAGDYALGVGASSSAGAAHTANAAATYTVEAVDGGVLTGAVGTDKASYLRGQTVYMSALARRDGVAVEGAGVAFTVTLPNGSGTVLTATSDGNGYARASYRIGKGKAAIGGYRLQAEVSDGSASTRAETAFSVR